MKISVVVPCRNESQYIKECIHAIYGSKLDKTTHLHVFIVDGMSNDGTREIVAEMCEMYPTLQLIDNIQQLTPFAFNLGILQQKADYIQIVGARHIISDNYIAKSLAVLQADHNIWCVGGKLINEYTTEISKIIAKAMDTSFGMGLGNFRVLAKSGYTDTVTSPLYPNSVFEQIGYFDEQLIRNQDDDFNYRVTKAGGKIWYENSISLKYYVRGNYKGLFKQFFQYGYWKVFVNRKHAAVTTLRQLVPPAFVLFLAIIPFTFLISPILFYLSISGLIAYVLLAIFIGFKKGNNLEERLGIMKTFPILHFSYGAGYLLGILHFFILRKNPSNKQKSLSR